MGDTIGQSENVTLHINIPSQNIEVRIIHNGNKIATYESDNVEYKVGDPGIYRVEVYHFNKAWIYSNHIRVGI